nr:recombinase family protein [Catellatospora sp. TT07R-123]
MTSPVVQRIYREFLGGAGIYAITEGLTRDGIPSPSATDPGRNPHRTGAGRTGRRRHLSTGTDPHLRRCAST